MSCAMVKAPCDWGGGDDHGSFSLGPPARCPFPVSLFGEGSPTKILTSLLEDLAAVNLDIVCLSGIKEQSRTGVLTLARIRAFFLGIAGNDGVP